MQNFIQKPLILFRKLRCTGMNQTQIRNEVLLRTATRIGVPLGEDVFASGLCLYVSHYLCEVMHERFGVQMLLQGGSALWKFRHHPTQNTHVGYEWQEDTDIERALQNLASGQVMPEFHTWTVIRPTSYLIDLCLPRFKVMANLISPGSGSGIPDTIWCHVRDVPEIARYRPSIRATVFVIRCLLREFGKLSYYPEADRFLEQFQNWRST